MATDTEQMARVAEAMVEVFRQSREREERGLHERRLIAACLRDFKKRRYIDWETFGRMLGLGTFSQRHIGKMLRKGDPLIPRRRARLITLKLLESHGYDVLNLYRVPIGEQKWRRQVEHYGVWATSRREWLALMGARGYRVRDPERVLYAG